MRKTDRELMELAIEVMKKSLNEPRSDGKVPPKVGAVIVFPNGRIETAYRGELREGDHAEFTLLERKLGNEKLDDCILFTTLEPCVKRNPPKVPCCSRTTNARIKEVYVGIEDKDPTVDGKGILHLEKHGVVVKMFDRDLQLVIEEENKEFLSQAIERKQKEAEEDLRGPMELPVLGFDASQFSDIALQKFIDRARLSFKPREEALYQYLADFGAMEWDASSKKYIPTGFGILLFGKNPRSKFPHAVLKAHVVYTDEDIEAKDFDDALVLIPDQLHEWLNKVLPMTMQMDGFQRKDVPTFPTKVLREAVINALVHRDYGQLGAKCEIKIDNDKIVVTSPGKPLPAIPFEKLNSFEAPSLSRNPIITYVFSQMDYMEEKGFGMKTFHSLQKVYGFPLPRFTWEEPFLVLTFPRTEMGLRSSYDHEAISQLKENEVRALSVFRPDTPLAKVKFFELAKLESERTAERMLKRFVELGLVQKVGEGKNTTYLIK